MSKTIDQRVVEMRFDNKHFESNVATTMSTLDKFKKSLDMKGASKGLEEVGNAAKKCDVSMVGDAAEKVGLKFNAMYTIADQALRNITNSAMAAGKRIVSALTIDPVKTGFSEYETQINAIQTILANTESKGTTLDDVNGALDELNTYADKTIYNFTEMTRNIGTFTAAGVDLDTSVSAIKGIANLAAVSGSTSQQASTAMYQLSQAMASGTVKLMDWNSVVNAGMGGQVFQNALKETAKVHGVAIDDIIAKNGSFRESLSEGWLTTEILTDTLAKFTGDLSKEQLLSMGYTEKQAEEILKLGQTANDAATKVKTFTQLFDTLKEAAQSGWTQTWEILVGDFEEAKELLTSISDTIGGMIGRTAEARNELLENWKVMGGRDDLIESFKNVWEALLSIIKPIKEAFREIFPPMTAERLVEITRSLKEFTARLKLSDKGAENLKKTFKGIFSVIKLGTTIIGAVLKAVGKLFKGIGYIGSGLLHVTAVIGDFLSFFVELITYGNIFEKVFNGVAAVINFAAKIIGALISAVATLFDFLGNGIVFPGLVVLIEGLKKLFMSFIGVGDSAESFGDRVSRAFASAGEVLTNNPIFKFMTKLWELIKIVGKALATFTSKVFGGLIDKLMAGDFVGILEIINGFITGGLGIGLIKLVKSFREMIDGTKDITGSIDDLLGSISGSFKAFQNSLNAEALKKLAVAIAILAASVLVLSFIDSEKLTDAIAAITILFANLMGGMAILAKSSGAISVAGITTAMIGLSVGILILSSALKKVSSLNTDQISVGLVGIMGLMTALTLSMKTLGTVISKDQKKVYMGVMQTIALALAAKMLASILVDLSQLSWDELGKGVIGLIVVMGSMVGAMKILPLGSSNIARPFFKFCAQMIIVAKSAQILANTLIDIAYLDWDELKIGIVGLVGVMTLLVGAMKILQLGMTDIDKSTRNISINKSFSSSGMYSTAAALVALAYSVKILVPAIKEFGDMDWTELKKAGVTFAGLVAAFTIFAAALKMVKPSTITSTASSLLTISIALLVLSGAMKVFGGMSWEQLGKAGAVLGAIVAALTLLSISSKLASPGSISTMAASMVILAVALNMLLVPLLAFSVFKWEMLAKAGAVLAGLVVALMMLGAITTEVNPGTMAVVASSLIILAVALQMLWPPLLMMGLISWSSIAKGLGILAAVLLMLTIVGTVVKELQLDVAILRLCASLALFAASMALIGIGIGFIGAGLAALGAGLAAFGAGLVAVVWEIIEICTILVEKTVEMFGRWIKALCKVVIEGAPMVAEAIIAVVMGLIDVLLECGPPLIEACLVLIDQLLKKLIEYGPGITESIFEILILTLESLRKFIAPLVDILVDVIIAIIDGVADKTPELIEAFVNLFAAIFDGLAAALSNVDTSALLKGVVAVGLLAMLVNKLATIKISIIPKAMLGLAGVGAILAELSLILAAIGGLAVIPGFKWLVSEGGDLLAVMGEALLKAVPAFSAVGLLLVAATFITPLIAPAMEGLLGLGAIVAEMALILAALGGLAQIPGLMWLINEGGNFLEAVGTAIGQFVGGIVGGIAQGVTSSFPKIGSDLSLFMTNVQPFIEGAKTIDSSVIDGVKNLVSAMLAITGGSLLEGLSSFISGSWLTGDSSISKFADELPILGAGLKGFSDAVVGVDPEAMTAATSAAKSLAEMANIIPNEGGKVAWFAGENSVSKFADQLPILGAGLKGFSDAVIGINAEAVSAATSAAKSLAEMADTIPNEGGVKAWFTGDNRLSKFSKDIVSLGLALKGFSDATIGINPETVLAAANSAKSLAEMADTIPNERGIVGWITGENSLSKFAGDIITLGYGLKGFSDATIGINPEAVTAAANAAKSIADMTNVIPKENGMKQWITGKASMSKFAGALPSLGTGIKGFSDSVVGINPEAVTAAANAAKSIADMTNVIPKENGMKQWITGKASMSKFANQIVSLGEGLKGFSDATVGINPETVIAAGNAAASLADMTHHIPKEDGIKQWFTGKSSVSKFANRLPALGKGLKDFSTSVAGINPENVVAAANAAKSLAEMTKTTPKDTGKLISFGDNLSAFGDKIAAYFSKTAGITADSMSASNSAIAAINTITTVNVGGIQAVSGALDSVTNSLKNMAGVPKSILSDFVKSLKSLGETSVKTFVKEFDKLDDKMKDAGQDAITEFTKGVDGRKSKATRAFEKVVEACVKAITKKKKSFENAGKDLVQGFANGISANSFKAEAKAKAMAEAALEAAKKALKINSPSKEFIKVGSGVPEGFAKGIDSLGSVVRGSVESMSNDSIDGVRNSISKIADLVDSDIDPSPTIRPVLDLDNVRKGANAIGKMIGSNQSVGVMANIGAISSIMDKKNQNGANDDVVSAINKLNKNLANTGGDTYTFGNISYDDGSSISEAVKALVRAAKIQGRV